MSNFHWMFQHRQRLVMYARECANMRLQEPLHFIFLLFLLGCLPVELNTKQLGVLNEN